MESEKLKKIETFVVECNEFIAGNYMIAGKKINLILKAIGSSPELYKYFEEKLSKFDFEKSFDSAFSESVNLPQGDELICLVFCILSDIDSTRLNLNQFICTYFRSENEPEIRNFAKLLITPFKNKIAKDFNVSSELLREQIGKGNYVEENVQKPAEQNSMFAGLEKLLKSCESVAQNILEVLDFYDSQKPEFEDARYIAKAIITACREENIELVNGLVIGLCYVSRKVKPIKRDVEEISDLIYDFYDALSCAE